MFIWSPDRNARRTLELAGHDEVGPYWDVDLQDRDRHLFSFKFLRNIDNKDIYEPGYANRLYLSTDGSEIWTHSEGREVIWSRPEKKLLTVHFQQRSDIGPPQMHLWQEASDFATDVEVSSTDNGWSQYEFPLYTGIPYRFRFHNDELEERRRWEHSAATRTVVLESDRPLWALEGDRHLFDAEPQADRQVSIRISHRPPASQLGNALFAHVWIDHARWPLHPRVAADRDRFPNDPPLVQVAREIEESSGYLHNLGVTAILLMPVNEVGSDNSWGYDPAGFYAVERDYGGPMDSQWCDDFHGRLVDACKGFHVMSRLADAMKLSHTHCQRWYNVSNYPESHDEVGNVNDRIANVAGDGRGLWMSKVAAAAALLSRGIPMFFMGAESGEHRQFKFGSSEALDLDRYQQEHHKKVRDWWAVLCQTRRNSALKGPAKLDVRYADGQILAFSRGLGDDFFAVLNFGGWAGWKSLTELNLPHQRYHELWNSSWPAFAVEHEGEHTNGGRGVRLDRGHWLHIPDYGAVVLERA